MKLEYLANGSPNCPLIRLYDFTTAEAVQFHRAVQALASSAAERLDVHRLPFVQSVGDCQLEFVRQSWDGAIVRGRGCCEFECGFTAGTWDNVAGLLKPFTQGTGGFQWLAGVPGEAALLLSASASGQW
jgi:hypothetical protein